MSFVQTRLSSSSFCLYTKLDSLVAPLHPHRHIATTSTLPITALHCTSLHSALHFFLLQHRHRLCHHSTDRHTDDIFYSRRPAHDR